ncbi:putative zinc finger CCHC domain-containing protein [Abeliophyllum distichum]|uniref:Zinc finger CCHC domain-containing protein n=1 Tax=Abeliophyllum distichum TaxID=126358 RepID=A0ABD1TXL4_9LAMI
MEDEEGGGFKLSKRFADKEGEVDYKTKSGTAWSHSFLNQKPWHPLSYPNQRRKWIAEQTHAQNQRRTEEVSREYAQEQDFFRQTALISKKEKEKLEMMKAVSFMYVKPPGYNAESAKAAEMAEERKKEQEQSISASEEPSLAGASSSMMTESMPSAQEKKKPRPKDVFGRALPTEEQFEVLKNAPRLETGAPARVKPFGVEIRNVKCLRCGNFGHQSGDRECPLKDAIMPNEENRLKRDDPLTAILAQTNPSEPLKWELKQKPGMSPPRGGFNPDDPNQQIVAEDIFDEYGGFLSGDNLPELLTNFSSSKPKKNSGKSKHRKSSPSSPEPNDHRERGSSGADKWRRSKKKRHKRSKKIHSESSSSESSDDGRYQKRSSRRRHRHSSSSEVSDSGDQRTSKHRHHRQHHHHHRHRHRHR